MTNRPVRKTSEFQIDKGSGRKLSQFVDQAKNEGHKEAKLALPNLAKNNPNSPSAPKSASAPAEINQQGRSNRASQDTPLSGERETTKKIAETTYGLVENPNRLSRKTSDYQFDKGQQRRMSQPVEASPIKQPIAAQQVSKMEANVKKRNSGEGVVGKESSMNDPLVKDGRKNSASKELNLPVKIIQNPQIQEANPNPSPKVLPDLKPKRPGVSKSENTSLAAPQQSTSSVHTKTPVTNSSSESSLSDKGHRLERKPSKEDLRKTNWDDEEYCFEKTLPAQKISKKKIVSSNADEWDDEEFYFEKTAATQQPSENTLALQDNKDKPNASAQGWSENTTALPDKSNLQILPLPKETRNIQEVMKHLPPKEQHQLLVNGSGQNMIAQEQNQKEIQMRPETKPKQNSDTRAEREILRPANAIIEITSTSEQGSQNQQNNQKESQSQIEKQRIEKLRQDYQDEQNRKQEQINLDAKLQREKQAELEIQTKLIQAAELEAQKSRQKQAELDEQNRRQQAEVEAKLQQQRQAEIEAQNERQRLAEVEEKEQRRRHIQLEVMKQRERLEQIRKAELEMQKERDLKTEKEAEQKKQLDMQQRIVSDKSQPISQNHGSVEMINKQLTNQASSASNLCRDEQPSSTRSPSRSSMKSSRDRAGSRKKSRDPRKILLNSDVAVIHVPLSDYVEDDKVLKKVPKRN